MFEKRISARLGTTRLFVNVRWAQAINAILTQHLHQYPVISSRLLLPGKPTDNFFLSAKKALLESIKAKFILFGRKDSLCTEPTL